MAATQNSEDILSAKTDICLSNALVKTGLGFAGGVVASAILFRRRPFAVFLGTGFGAGSAYSDCNRLFNPASIPGFKIAGTSSADVKAELKKGEAKAESLLARAESAVKTKVGEAKDKAVEVKDKLEGKKEEVKKEVKRLV